MSYKIIGKYIKDLKFNIPNPKVFFLLSKDISNYKINIDINSIQVKQNIIEVLTSLSLTPNSNNFEKIETKIIYSTIVELKTEKTLKEEMEKIILIKVPSEIYSGMLFRYFLFAMISPCLAFRSHRNPYHCCFWVTFGPHLSYFCVTFGSLRNIK